MIEFVGLIMVLVLLAVAVLVKMSAFNRNVTNAKTAVMSKAGGAVLINVGTGPGTILQGKAAKWVDSVVRHIDITAVNTWTALTAFGATTEGSIQVPSKAKFLTKIEISTAFDVDSTAAVYKLLSAIRLSGNGLVKGGLYKFFGQVGSHVQVNNFSAMSKHKITTYMTRIPVSPSDKITVEGIMLAEDMGALTIAVCLHFSASDPGAGILDSDIRHANITAVSTPTGLNMIGADTEGSFKVPSDAQKIIGLVKAIAVDFTAGAAAQRALGAFALSGNGLASGGMYQGITQSSAFAAQAAAGDGLGGDVEISAVDLDVKGSDTITASGQMIGEDSGDMEFALGILYG